MVKKLLSAMIILGLVGLFSTTLNAADVPTKKKKLTPQGLYITAKEAHDMVKANSAKILFIDVRTPEELYMVGYTDMIDKNIPIAYVDYTKIKEKKGKAKFASTMNAKFKDQVEAALKAKGLTKDDKIIFMCRSGSRSTKSAKIMDKAGYKNIYTVVDAFEGDKDKVTHKRTVNGWKNAGLPWGYTFHKEKFTLER